MNFLARIGHALTKPIFNGYDDASGLGGIGFKGVDYEQHIGEMWKSGILLSSCDENGDWVNVPSHKALAVLRQFRPFNSAAPLFDCIRWDQRVSL